MKSTRERSEETALEKSERIAYLINQIGEANNIYNLKKILIQVLNLLNVRIDDLEHSYEQIARMESE
jgi:hypothetical protein